MHPVVTFWTEKFDVSREPENPINPIPGQSLLLWLRDRAGEEMAFQEPDTEDWGWYSTVVWDGRAYLLGAMAAEREAGGCDWAFQVDKHRTLLEKLLGREKMTREDECFQFFLAILENEPDFHDVTVE